MMFYSNNNPQSECLQRQTFVYYIGLCTGYAGFVPVYGSSSVFAPYVCHSGSQTEKAPGACCSHGRNTTMETHNTTTQTWHT